MTTIRDAPQATNAEIHQRDGYRCARCGKRSQSVQHRIHGDRSDNRPSNLVAVCGSGTTGCHGWMESHRKDSREVWGWEVSKHQRGATTEISVWYENHPVGRGWLRLNDDLTVTLVERVPA